MAELHGLRPKKNGERTVQRVQKRLYSAALRVFYEQRIFGDPRCCWEWPGLHSKDGYGLICLVDSAEKLHYFLVHRLAWEVANQKSARGKHVRHSCDNPPCWNPQHLKLGTRLENMRDMVEKGRNR